jgi:hypothetical protein
VSTTAAPASTEQPTLPDGRRDSPVWWRRRRLVLAAGAVIVTVGVIVAVVNPFGGSGSSSVDNGAATSLATVNEQDLSSQTDVSGTLGYAGSYTVPNQAQGTVTWLPTVGQVVSEGQTLYQVSNRPVVLLYGTTPAYRALSQGTTGPDVKQLNAALVATGYATRAQLEPTSDTFSAATATALKAMQTLLGETQTGTLALGDAVFLPSAARVTTVTATLGASAGGSIMTASSATRVVSISLNAAQQAQVKVGDPVVITLPNNQTTPGVVWSVGTVATTPSNGGTPTVDVVVVPTDPAATGSLDQAPVHVSISTATAKHALVVPVNALLALSGGGYAIETVSANGSRHLVPVALGIFDDADGLVQVSGAGVSAGQRVVVPST